MLHWTEGILNLDIFGAVEAIECAPGHSTIRKNPSLGFRLKPPNFILVFRNG